MIVYTGIISFLSSIRDRIYAVEICFKVVEAYIIEGTPSLWKEFVWPHYNSHEECRVKEVLNEGVWTTYQSIILSLQ